MGKRGKAPTPAFMRVWDKVDSTGECWTYGGGSKVAGGYRQMAISRLDGQALVHRVVWEAEYGPVPDGLELRHICHTPNCVRPGHVILGTRQENERDKDPFRVEYDRRRTRH